MSIFTIVLLVTLGVKSELTALVPEDCATNSEATKGCFQNGFRLDQQLNCLIKADAVPHVENGCGVNATESIHVHHFCIGSDGTSAGWGFKVPVVTALLPKNILNLKISGIAYGTTDPRYVFADGMPVRVDVVADTEQNVNKTLIRKCEIENAAGPRGEIKLLGQTEKGNFKFELELDNPGPSFKEEKVIVGKTMMLKVAGDKERFANGGPVPPAVMNVTVNIKHRMLLDL